jgi:hypothetical protein
MSSDPVVRSTAHIISGNLSPQLLHSYLEGSTAPERRAQKIVLLLPRFAHDREGAQKLLDTLFEIDHFRIFRGWFNQSEPVNWREEQPLLKLLLMVCSGDGLKLGVEQMGDLMTFPSIEIRLMASRFFQEKFSDPRNNRMLAFLSAADNNLSQMHTVSLLLALQSSSEASFGFIQQWFETEPDPLAVLQILIARATFEDLDYFNVEAARYLKDAEWDSPPEVLAGLMGHPEALARSIAYARLAPGQAEGRALLEQMIRVEPIERIRRELQRKLELAD